MKPNNSLTTTEIFQLIVIALMSISASYAFLNTQTNLTVDGICFYRYLAYGMTVVFSYVCVSRYNKYIAFLLSFALFALALSPFSRHVVNNFPACVSFLAILMGITTVLLVPSARGRGFFEFLLTLLLPTILAESRLGGFAYFITTSQSIAHYKVFVITIIVVGGYFYLRYATWGRLAQHDLLSRGEKEDESRAVNRWTSLISGTIVVGATGITTLLAIVAPIIAGAFQPLLEVLIGQSYYAFALMGCIGLVVVCAVFAFQILARTK